MVLKANFVMLIESRPLKLYYLNLILIFKICSSVLLILWFLILKPTSFKKPFFWVIQKQQKCSEPPWRDKHKYQVCISLLVICGCFSACCSTMWLLWFPLRCLNHPLHRDQMTPSPGCHLFGFMNPLLGLTYSDKMR